MNHERQTRIQRISEVYEILKQIDLKSADMQMLVLEISDKFGVTKAKAAEYIELATHRLNK